jgi:hypothetical protein
MNPLAFLILALVIIGLAVGSAINFGFAFLALPLLAIFGWLAVGKEALLRQRKIQQMKRFRRAAKARKVEFDDDDRKTIAV